jgi:hypothetical protein
MSMEAMVVNSSIISQDALLDPAMALSAVYRNFYFSGTVKLRPDIRTVRAYVKLPRAFGGKARAARRLGGLVLRADFNESIDPVRFRVRRTLGKNPLNITLNLALEQVRERGQSLEFIFRPA